MTTTKTGNSTVKVENTIPVVEDNKVKPEEFFYKNSKILSILVGIVVLIGAGFAFYSYQNKQKDKEAQTEMFGAVYYFEADSLDKALKGDGKNSGLLDIAESYGSTKSGNLANFYIGAIYLKKGKFDDAIEYLKNFSSDDLLLQARGYSLLGDAYLEQKDVENAIDYYKKASDYHPNDFFTPKYLMKLALAYELNKDYKAASESYQKIVEEHFKSAEVLEAKKLQAVAEGKINQ